MNANFKTWEEAVIWLKSQPDYLELVKAGYYDDPLNAAADRFFYSLEWKEIVKRLPLDGTTVLDIGAGRGISSYAFAREGWIVYALEPDSSPVVGARAIHKLSNDVDLSIHIIQAYAESIPFRDNSFDLVYGRQVLHHAHHLSKMCKEIARILKPNGRFFFTREHVINCDKDLEVFLKQHPLHHLYGKEHAYTLKEYLKNLEGAGFVLNEILNPYGSDINLYPNTIDSIKQSIAEKLHLPINTIIPDSMVIFLGNYLSRPGRLFSFIGTKK